MSAAKRSENDLIVSIDLLDFKSIPTTGVEFFTIFEGMGCITVKNQLGKFVNTLFPDIIVVGEQRNILLSR